MERRRSRLHGWRPDHLTERPRLTPGLLGHSPRRVGGPYRRVAEIEGDVMVDVMSIARCWWWSPSNGDYYAELVSGGFRRVDHYTKYWNVVQALPADARETTFPSIF